MSKYKTNNHDFSDFQEPTRHHKHHEEHFEHCEHHHKHHEEHCKHCEHHHKHHEEHCKHCEHDRKHHEEHCEHCNHDVDYGEHHYDKNDHFHKDKHDDDCVCETVKKINKAQAAVEDSNCKVSCENSIKQLLSKHKSTANTIPFSLDCGCETFLGKAPIYCNSGNFQIIASPFFKVKKVNHDCCAVLELLWPTCDGEAFQGHFNNDGISFPCCDFDGFVGTGACITVDLKCFCSISCHKPTMIHQATAWDIDDIFKGHKHSKCE